MVAAAIICVAGSFSVGSIRILPFEGHKSSLRATVTLTDGTVRTVTLQGVGCIEGMCSRVRASEVNAGRVWLDGLVSVREISHDAHGPVHVIFKCRDGAERQASIVAGNRVLYVQDRFGRAEKLDLATLTKIDFE